MPAVYWPLRHGICPVKACGIGANSERNAAGKTKPSVSVELHGRVPCLNWPLQIRSFLPRWGKGRDRGKIVQSVVL